MCIINYSVLSNNLNTKDKPCYDNHDKDWWAEKQAPFKFKIAWEKVDKKGKHW